MANKITTENIFTDLGFDENEAENLKIRAQLMRCLVLYMHMNKLTQSEAAAKFKVSQPRVSDLTRGKINLFTIDMLIKMLSCAHVHVNVQTDFPMHEGNIDA